MPTNKNKIFVSIIWGYPKYFCDFAIEEHYHMHALKIAKELGYKVVVIIQNEPGIIENDPQLDKDIEIIYYSNIFNYLYQIIKYSVKSSVFYVNSVEPQSLIVPFLARKTIFMGHTHPIRQTKLKQMIFNLSMKFFSKIRLNNGDEKKFLLQQGITEEKLQVVPLSVSFKDYKILDERQERKDLVYFGNITNKKNLPTIIKACNIVCEKYPEIKLHILGKEKDIIDNTIISPKLNVIKYGFTEKASDVNILLNKYLIYLNSSFDEGMCVAVYNAALAGCALCLPTIMSFTGVFKDKALFHKVTDHEQLAKNIIYYLENPKTISEHNKLCREMIIKDYNYQKISELMKDLFTFKDKQKNADGGDTFLTKINKTVFKTKRYIKPLAKLISSKKIRRLLLYINGKFTEYSYKKTILRYYNTIPLEKINAEKREVLEYLKLNPATLFPYDFIDNYKASEIEVLTDTKKKLKYVLFYGKRLYFKRSCSEAEIKILFNSLILSQDIKSPHRYLTEDFNVSENDIIADIGSAEGDFSLKIIDKVKKIYLFETDPELIEALQSTFEPWKEKVIIINKYVSDKSTDNHISLDSYFKGKELPDLIKIDVEGAEYNLLCGAKSLLSSKKSLKIVVAAYHRYNDEIILRNELDKYGFTSKFSNGYMLSIWDDILIEPYLRRGLIRANK